jgi:peptidoglycan-associated lipoprotein
MIFSGGRRRMFTHTRLARLTFVAVLLVAAVACGKKKAPVLEPPAPTPTTEAAPAPTPPPPAPTRVAEPPVPTPAPVREENVTAAASTLDDLNRSSPLKPVFFALDSSDIDTAAKTILDADAAILKQNSSWVITVEGHCDERGTAEYNLALGDRRAAAAVAYLRSLGIPAERLKTVSYGKEFPFDPGHDESAWSKNRRAHFVITAK